MSLSMLITVGSDHHPFDRLVVGVDRWLAQTRPVDVDVLFQYGTAQRPEHGTRCDYLSHDELIDRLGSTDIVVTQGGPMGILESRRCGRVPIVMPRLHHLREAVDDHQVAFCRQLATMGDIVLVETAGELSDALDKASHDPSHLVLPESSRSVDTSQAVQAFARAVEALPPARRGLARWRRR